MTTRKPKDETPPASPPEPLLDADGNPIDPQEGGVTPPDLDAPTTLPPAEPAPEFDGDKPVTMADVAALHGIGLAPDESVTRTVRSGEVFISAGMASDLEQQGWAVDPNTGRKVEREPKE